MRHTGKLFALHQHYEDMNGWPIATARFERSLLLEEDLYVDAEDFFVADSSGRVVFVCSQVDARYLAFRSGTEDPDRVRRHLPRFGDPAFYRALGRLWPRSSQTSLAHGDHVEVEGWAVAATLSVAEIDAIAAEIGNITDVWVLGEVARVRRVGPEEAG